MNEANKRIMRSFERSLRALNRAPRTIRSYIDTLAYLANFCPDTPLIDIDRDQVADYIDHLLTNLAPATAAHRFRNLRRFYTWAEDEEIITRSPMAKMKEPVVPEAPVPVFTDADIRAMMSATKGGGLTQRRNHAIVRVLLDTGIRVSELTGLKVTDVDFRLDTVTVLGKGRRVRVIPFGSRTGTALDRYLRLCPTDAVGLWQGKHGQLTTSGVNQILRRLEKTSGVSGIHPHRFRHTFAHHWKRAGGSDDDLMRLTGWRSREMLARYGASAADERAYAAHKRLGLADKF